MAVHLRIPETWPRDDETLMRLGSLNDHLRIEQEPNGELEVTPPSGAWAGHCAVALATQLSAWNDRCSYGLVFGADAGFRLPSGALRSPDVALVAATRLAALGRDWRGGFLPLAPDLAIEVQSPSDRRERIVEKLRAYRDEGTAVAMLFDPAGDVILIDVRGERLFVRPSAIDVEVIETAPLRLRLSALYLSGAE